MYTPQYFTCENLIDTVKSFPQQIKYSHYLDVPEFNIWPHYERKHDIFSDPREIFYYWMEEK